MMNLEEIKKITNIIHQFNIVCNVDIEKIYSSETIVLEMSLDGTINAIHIYDNIVSRFDNKTMLGIAKFIYRNSEWILKLLFINDDIEKIINPIYPSKTITINSKPKLDEIMPSNIISLKTVLLNLFNSFKYGELCKKSLPYYYSPFRKDIYDIILK
ncbi:virion protein [Deerpox virus W-848-83]|uniref:Virion protein n=1 Tax=Deerpox virus (strain Mule deer/United States/W-848-83/1983) TaxID=305674 RepID=Q08FR3_DPV83|nr:Virion protein [Deerpox virus W-848-83]ABI99244.1 virion protein [Deerpox virus W-848-83]